MFFILMCERQYKHKTLFKITRNVKRKKGKEMVVLKNKKSSTFHF